MELKNKILKVSKNELIQIIINNNDFNSREIDMKLINTIEKYYGRFSIKQLKWITHKVNFIVRHNDFYQEYNSMKDIELLPETENEVLF